MNGVLRVLLAVVIVLGSVVFGLFGLFVFLYGYENGGRTVTLAGNQVDAEIAGVLGLLIASGAVLAAAWLVRAYGHPRFANRLARPS